MGAAWLISRMRRFHGRELKGQPRTWAVALDLWTAEEGRSDLTLSATVTAVGHNIDVEIDDLHVL
jgi:hypothetical protein